VNPATLDRVANAIDDPVDGRKAMPRRSETETRSSIAFALCVAALVGCAAGSPTVARMPNAEERAAAEAAGFEVDPVRSAAELLPPDLLTSPHYRIDPQVVTSGFLNRYAITSDYGDFEVRGDRMLRTRIREIEALAALDEMSKTTTFSEAAGNALKSPFVATWNLITNPVDTILGIPTGAWNAIEQTSQLARGERGALEDSGALALIGFEAKKRQIANELDVDPYSSNKALQKQLNRFAWAAYLGGLPYLFVPFVDDSDFQKTSEEPADGLAEILSIYSPEDLRRLNRIELAVMGISEPLSDKLIGHPWYSPRHATALVEALAALDLTQNRSAFIEAAVSAESEDDALFYEHTAELMRSYGDRVSPIGEIVNIGGTPTGITESHTLVIPLPADYVIWTPATAALARAIGEGVAGHPNIERSELVLSGAASPLARERFEALGIAVTERAFEQPEGKSARLPEPSP
jgi:hypothetical protein